MSDNVLKLIPTDPQFVPDSSAQEMAAEYLQSILPNAEQVRARVLSGVEFVDQGENFERILCPGCGSQLGIDWWHKVMANAHKTEFSQLQIALPCCGATSSLNDLRYIWPAGFARFVLEARNPNADLDDEQLRSLGSILHSELRKIWARY